MKRHMLAILFGLSLVMQICADRSMFGDWGIPVPGWKKRRQEAAARRAAQQTEQPAQVSDQVKLSDAPDASTVPATKIPPTPEQQLLDDLAAEAEGADQDKRLHLVVYKGGEPAVEVTTEPEETKAIFNSPVVAVVGGIALVALVAYFGPQMAQRFRSSQKSN
jgi:hypothetical protein